MSRLKRVEWIGRRWGFWMMALLSGGCVTAHVSRMPVTPVSAYMLKEEKAGVLVGIDPVTDKKRLKEIFGRDLLGDDHILPIMIAVENRTEQRQIFLERTDIRLEQLLPQPGSRISIGEEERRALDAAGRQWYSINEPFIWYFNSQVQTLNISSASIAEGSAVALWGAAIIALQIMKFTDSQIVHFNMTEKAFLDRVIAPGGSQRGFVYFRSVTSLENRSIEIILRSRNPVISEKTEYLGFAFPFSASLERGRK